MILKRLVILLAVWAIAAFALYDAYEYEVRITQLKENGVVTVGKITSIESSGEDEDKQWNLLVSFETEDSETYEFETELEGEGKYKRGDIVGVFYSKENPSNAIMNSSSIVTGHAFISILIGLVFGFLGLWLFGVTIFQISKLRFVVR